MALVLHLLFFLSHNVSAAANDGQMIHPDCLAGTAAMTKAVTHYMVPLLKKYDHQVCDVIEGTCIYKQSGTQYIHNYGRSDISLTQAQCKNGWGNHQNCLHPCRTIAASMAHHQYGQIVFMKELAGQKCGNLKRDGFEMIHDGYVVVMDTGSPVYFHEVGRFDFFWGRCQNQKSGECFEGAIPLSSATSHSEFCTVWDPSRPQINQDVKNRFVQKVKDEDRQRGDVGAANDFNL